MAVTAKVLFRGAATTTTTTTLYTAGASVKAVVTSIVISNSGATTATWTMAIDSQDIGNTVSIAANSVAIIDLKQVVDATKIITGGASSTNVKFHISGVEIS